MRSAATLGPWLRAAFLFGAAGLLNAATAPAWLTESAPADDAPGDSSGLVLHDERDVNLQPGGTQRRLVRWAARLREDDGHAVLHQGQFYNQDFGRIISAQAWIIRADGKHVEHFGRGDFVTIAGDTTLNTWSANRVIAFAQVDQVRVGDTVAYEMEVENQTGMGDATEALRGLWPSRHVIVDIQPEPGGTIRYDAPNPAIPPPVSNHVTGGLHWELNNVPGPVRNMPAGFHPDVWVVRFRGLAPGSPDHRFDTWQDFAGAVSSWVSPQMKSSPALEAEVRECVAHATTRWERIRLLSERVQKQVQYLSINLDKDSLAGLRPHFPDEVWKSHLGDCKDKSTLLATMLRSIGEPAYLVLVEVEHRWSRMPPWPSQTFNHMIIAIPADADVPPRWPTIAGGPAGRLVLFDPTAENIPFGLLPETDRGSPALVLMPGTTDLTRLPPHSPETSATTRTITAKVTADGNAAISVEQVCTGEIGAAWESSRRLEGNQKFEDSLTRRYHAALPLLESFQWKEAWDPLEARDRLSLTFFARAAMRPLGPDRLMIKLQLMAADRPFKRWKTDASGGVAVGPEAQVETVRLELPESFVVDGLPPDVHLEIPTAEASLHYRIDGGTLVYDRTVKRTAAFLHRADYEALCAFQEKLNEAERRTVIVKRAAVAK
ncbi:MAG TPA: transglutaminase domain-containing protein [Candidatus Didemnitutus sp.]|jgi:hypothetical protein